MGLATICLVLALLTTAMVAGLFYGYACSVNPGLGRLPDATYLAAMQSINAAILNPVFFSCFMGAAVLLPLGTGLHASWSGTLRFWLLAVATALYIFGTFGVTIAFNVPLNERLRAIDLGAATSGELSVARTWFERPWNRWHLLRTIASTLSVVLLILACLAPSDAI